MTDTSGLTSGGGSVTHLRVDGRVVAMLPLAYGGHALYCRKLEMGEADVERHLRRVGALVVPGRALDNCGQFKFVVMEVLATGPMVEKRCSKAHAEEYKRPRWLAESAKVGDMILLPFYDPARGKSSPFSPDEYFIEESAPLAVFESE